MILAALAFYLFAFVAVASAVMVVAARNPVHSVLFLILAFFNAAGLFVLLGAEFIAFILIIVYVGAVAVLFLFVVMMLDINFVALREGFLNYLPIGGLIGLVLLAELILVAGAWIGARLGDPATVTGLGAAAPPGAQATNAQALGQVLYTDYIYLFQASGMVLLVAMIGAIVLTLRDRPGVRRQVVSDQIRRSREDSVELRDVPPGRGL